MADCSKTEAFLGEWERMCHREDCPTCYLSSYNNMTESELTCTQFIRCCPQEAIKIVQEWSDNNPQQPWILGGVTNGLQ